MYEIFNNYLFLKRFDDFNHRIFNYFYNRLQLFLCINFDKYTPGLIISDDITTINKYYNDITLVDDCRAFYDEDSKNVVFNSNKYLIGGDECGFGFVDVPDEFKNKYNYCIPISDIYHELIHHIQYHNSIWDYGDLIEGTADLYSYLLTGQQNIDYLKHSIAIFNVGDGLLKLKKNKFYMFIRDCIISNNFYENYFTHNKKFIKILAKNYNGNINKFFNNFKNDFGIFDTQDVFYTKLNSIHNLIFYKYWFFILLDICRKIS